MIYLLAKAGAQCSGNVEQFLEAGTRLLASGQLADALTQFHSAVGNTLSKFINISNEYQN